MKRHELIKNIYAILLMTKWDVQKDYLIFLLCLEVKSSPVTRAIFNETTQRIHAKRQVLDSLTQ